MILISPSSPVRNQAGDVKKDLVDVHGANLHLVDGKIGKAGRACAEASEENDWYVVTTF
jgi:threonine synthase